MRHAEAAAFARHGLEQADAGTERLGPLRLAQLEGQVNSSVRIKRFFEYLESKAYKMHIRVLLSKYRSYTPCEAATARA